MKALKITLAVLISLTLCVVAGIWLGTAAAHAVRKTDAARQAATPAPTPAPVTHPLGKTGRTVEETLAAGLLAQTLIFNENLDYFSMIHAVLSKDETRVCFTFASDGLGSDYLLMNTHGHGFVAYHRNGLIENSAGRLDYRDPNEMYDVTEGVTGCKGGQELLKY